MIIRNPASATTEIDYQPVLDSLYFLHIPKTAGTSLRHWLHDLLFSDHDLLRCDILEQVDRLDRETINSYRFFSGHFGWKIFDYLDRPTPTLTWLRDPVKRAISSYNYNRDQYDELVQIALDNGHEEWINAYELFRELPLGDLVSDARYVGYVDNLQTRYLSGVFPAKDSILVDDEILERAKANLEKMFFFGVCEWMDASADALCYQLSFPQQRMNLEFNRTATGARSALTEAELLKIEESESFDRKLYQYACDLFQSRYADVWNAVDDRNEQVEVSQIYGQYEAENTRIRIEDFLNRRCQQRQSQLQRPLVGKLSFSDPIYQSGWYPRSGLKKGPIIRWAGPSNTSTVFFPFDSNYDYEVEFFIRYLADYRFVQSLCVETNGVAIAVDYERLDAAESPSRQYKVKFKVPAEAIATDQSYTKVEFKVTGELVDMGLGDGSQASFATDGFHFRSLAA